MLQRLHGLEKYGRSAKAAVQNTLSDRSAFRAKAQSQWQARDLTQEYLFSLSACAKRPASSKFAKNGNTLSRMNAAASAIV